MITENELIETFEMLDAWEDRYKLLIDIGRDMPPMPPELKTDSALVGGCTSQVWLVPDCKREGIFDFYGDSDALIVKGLIGVLHVLLAGKTHDAARNTDIESIFRNLGLEEHLSPNRRNGFFAMLDRLREMIRHSP